jgi:predicted RNase H-like HicB family nuclease
LRRFESERAGDHSTWELTVRVRKDELDGGWVAECPELPGCFSQGETEDEALRNISDAIAGIISLRVDQSVATRDGDEFKISVAS